METSESPADSRRAVAYLVASESDEYVAIMAALEASVTDLLPAEIVANLYVTGRPLDERTVVARLDQLRHWGAVSARTDSSRILRHADLLARNWRYTATPAGRQVQRFYATVLAGAPTMREIPLTSLTRVVDSLEQIVFHLTMTPLRQEKLVELVGRLFTSHDDLDTALVGAEDALAALADRYDLDAGTTAELKGLLVDYATRVAAELESGAAAARRLLVRHLEVQFGRLAAMAVESSDARALIQRGALAASRGGRVADWEGLMAWCDPDTGRAARFALRLVRALPGMHANLRRLHASAGMATGRARALALARACRDPEHGTTVLLAALGDHPWRKLYGETDDSDLGRNPPWRAGPSAIVPEMLRTTGRAGPRGRPPAAKDDAGARAVVQALRRQRSVEHAAAVREILDTPPGVRLSARAARVAMEAVMAAVRAPVGGTARDRRVGTSDGLSCTLFHTGTGTGLLLAPTWQVWLPGRVPVFHLPGGRAQAPVATSPDHDVRAVVSLVEPWVGAA